MNNDQTDKELLREVRALAGTLSTVVTKLDNISDHEGRIRALELAIARSAWLPVIVTALITSGIAALAVRLIDFG